MTLATWSNLESMIVQVMYGFFGDYTIIGLLLFLCVISWVTFVNFGAEAAILTIVSFIVLMAAPTAFGGSVNIGFGLLNQGVLIITILFAAVILAWAILKIGYRRY